MKPSARSCLRLIFAGLVWGAALSISGVFVWFVGHLVVHGLPHLTLDFLLSEPRHAGRAGGIAPILVSTALILVVCLGTAVPLALATAIVIAEFSPVQSRFGRLIRRSIDVLAGVPSIVFGLFGNALFSKVLGLGFSIAAGGLTLACMVLPLLVRTLEEGLRSQPKDYRLAAAALGFTRSASLIYLLLPAAAPSLLVGIILALGRAMAETAALIYTSGYVDRMPSSLSDSGRSLAVHIFDLSMNVTGGDGHAYATSLTLIAVLFTMNAAAAWLLKQLLQKRVFTP